MNIALNTAALLSQPLAWVQHVLASVSQSAPRKAAGQPRALARGRTLVVSQPLGQMVLCTEGTLWITHDHEPLDHIVDGGQRYVAGCGSRMMVHALTDARVSVVDLPAR